MGPNIVAMRKKISVSQLRIGMFLDELCGSWLDHPSWKSAFLLTDPKRDEIGRAHV